MTRKEIIDGLKFTVDMFLFDPVTGEEYKEPRNDMDKTTIDACKGAIELLEQTDGDLISRESVITMLQKIENSVEDGEGYQFNEWVEYVKDIPSAEKTAEWIDLGFKDEEYGKFGECSNCGVETFLGSNYCPNCGAKMREVEE